MAKLRAALEAALMEDPDDLSAHMAYGDHLAEQGDPRGEFIQVQLALEDQARPASERAGLVQREADLLAAHQAEWLAELADPILKPEHGGPAETQCRWERGWLSEVALWSLSLETARALRSCPAARLLKTLGIKYNWQFDASEETELQPDDGLPPSGATSALAALRGAAFLPNLRVVRIGEPVDYDEESYDSTGTSAAGILGVLEQTARLESLHLFARGAGLDDLLTMRCPRLRQLILYHDVEYHLLGRLANNAGMPALEILRIHPAHSDQGHALLPAEEVIAFMRSPHFPALRELHLHASDLGAEGCAFIAISGILNRIKVLNLRHGCIQDAGARILAACPAIVNLELLDLSENELTEEGVATIAALPIATNVRWQGTPGENAYLYSGDME